MAIRLWRCTWNEYTTPPFCLSAFFVEGAKRRDGTLRAPGVVPVRWVRRPGARGSAAVRVQVARQVRDFFRDTCFTIRVLFFGLQPCFTFVYLPFAHSSYASRSFMVFARSHASRSCTACLQSCFTFMFFVLLAANTTLCRIAWSECLAEERYIPVYTRVRLVPV